MQNKTVKYIGNLLSQPNPSHISDIYDSKLDIDESVILTAWLWAQMRSKDPNTKVGAAVYDASTGSIHLGYNGFPAGIEDKKEIWDNRNKKSNINKYAFVNHAECNSVRKAIAAGFDHNNATLYLTHYPCHDCVKDFIIPSKIKMIIYAIHYPYDEISEMMLKEVDVSITKIDIPGLEHD